MKDDFVVLSTHFSIYLKRERNYMMKLARLFARTVGPFTSADSRGRYLSCDWPLSPRSQTSNVANNAGNGGDVVDVPSRRRQKSI